MTDAAGVVFRLGVAAFFAYAHDWLLAAAFVGLAVIAALPEGRRRWCAALVYAAAWLVVGVVKPAPGGWALETIRHAVLVALTALTLAAWRRWKDAPA